MCKRTIAILLSTYNGEKFLGEQLDSLFNQTFLQWDLYIHDDGSNDSTKSIIAEYATKYNNIKMLNFCGGCGAKNSFLRMLQEVDADYYFFCDQDDVWDSMKVQESISQMEQLEILHSKNKPIIVHSDLTVVDRNLKTINESFWEVMMIRPESLKTFNQIGANCLVTGCTMCFNRAAKNVTLSFAEKAVMHDVWITLCVAKNNGIIFAIDKSLIKYRQHGSNTIGAKDKRKEAKLYYKIMHLGNIIKENRAAYRMLRELEYGSIFKFMYYKIKYRFHL